MLIVRTFEILKIAKKAFWEYRWKILILMILGVVSGLLEGIGVNALIPLFSSVIGGESSDVISKMIRQFFYFIHTDFSLKYLLIFICTLFIIKALIALFCQYVNIKIAADYEKAMRSKLTLRMLNSKWSYLVNQKIGHLETLLLTDIERVSTLLQWIGEVILNLTGLLIYLIVAINISFNITVITVLLGILIFIIFRPLVNKMRIISTEGVKVRKIAAHYVNESVIGMKTLKAMNRASSVLAESDKLFNVLKKVKVKAAIYRGIPNYLLQPISLIFICAIFAFSYKTSSFSLPSLIAIIYLINRIFQYFQSAQRYLHSINESYPFLRDVLAQYEEFAVNEEKNIGKEKFHYNQVLEFKNVSFSYDGIENVLIDFDLKINRGEMVGIIGPSGGGKTTLVDLTLRLLEPTTGEIFLDNQNIKKIDLKNWRRNIGYVSQDIFLMNDTIENNIKFYNNNLSKDDIESAAKQANIYDFIQSCQNKFDTIVGERGTMLSGGQRQRIILARIFAQKPELLVLDEATSALDNESELKIQKVIENLKGKMTVVVIAHRLSTVLNCDKIIAIEKGRIVESGNPAELLKDINSYFYKTYNIRK